MESIVPTLDSVPVGFRFRPTDEELVDYYLKHKLQHDDTPVHIIPELDLCKVEPWEVPAKSEIKSDQEWFFFSPIDYKYPTSKRVNRTTECGYWKATGNERYIKTRGTNNVIGAKKTLVFYKGRVAKGVKSNWVIHEYHAVTFDENQRTIVLCRLMKKADKKAEGGNDALICEEGEPSKNMDSDYENQATAEGIADVGTLQEINTESIHQAEKCTPSTQQSPIGIEQEASFSNSPSHNAYFRNENSIMQTSFETTSFETIGEEDEFLNSILIETSFETTPFETTEEEDEFLNSILIDEDFVINEEIGYAFVNSSTQSKSLKRVYCESSDTDAEVVSELYGNVVDTSTVCNEHPSSGEYHISKRFKSSHDTIHGGIYHLSPIHEANNKKKKCIFQDDFWELETSSCESTIDKPLEINGNEISSPPEVEKSVSSKTRNLHMAKNFCKEISNTEEGFKQCSIPS